MATNKQQVLLRQLTGIQADIAIGLKKSSEEKRKRVHFKSESDSFQENFKQEKAANGVLLEKISNLETELLNASNTIKQANVLVNSLQEENLNLTKQVKELNNSTNEKRWNIFSSLFLIIG